MIRAQWLSIVVRRKQYVVAIQIGQRHVRRKTLFGKNQHIFRSWLRVHPSEHFAKTHALPFVIKAAPAGHAMEVAMGSNRGQRIEFLPIPSNRILDQSRYNKIPSFGVEARHRPVVKYRPFQGE